MKNTPAAGSGHLACSLLAPESNRVGAVDAAVLLAAYNSQVRTIRSLHVIGLLRGKSGVEYGIGKQPFELPIFIDFVSPDFIRVTGAVATMGDRGFEMTSDGKEFRLLVPENGKKTFLIGPVDAPAHSPRPRENLRPQPLIDALRWREGRLRVGTKLLAPAQSEANSNTQILELDLVPDGNGPSAERVVFDLGTGVVNSLTTYDASGKELSETTYLDWEMMSTYPESVPVGCFPRRIHLVRQDRDYEIDIRITEIALNPSIPMSRFRPSPPRGIPVVHVNMAGDAVGH
jgi:outer membrane lipoprotein-sorting protein